MTGHVLIFLEVINVRAQLDTNKIGEIQAFTIVKKIVFVSILEVRMEDLGALARTAMKATPIFLRVVMVSNNM